jgi:Ca2+-binding EF-hand superfamily protein/CRP-like cAMP-binding protein
VDDLLTRGCDDEHDFGDTARPRASFSSALAVSNVDIRPSATTKSHGPAKINHPLRGALEYHAEQLLLGMRESSPGNPCTEEIDCALKRYFDGQDGEITFGKGKKLPPLSQQLSPGETPEALQQTLADLHNKIDNISSTKSSEDEAEVQKASPGLAEDFEEGSKEYLAALSAQVFNMMDQDENAEIDLAEAAQYIKSAGIIQMSPQEVAEIYDEDHNGKINLNEFRAILTDVYSSDDSVLGSAKEEETGIEEESKYAWLHRPMDPDSPAGFRCTFFTMLFVLYSAFLIPARLGFESDEHAGIISNFLDYASELWFVIDIFVSFRLGYVDSDTQELVMDFPTIRTNYLRGWFALDSISSLPVKTATLMYPNMANFGFLKVFRMCKLFRLVKLLKLKALEDLEDSGAVSPSMIRLAKIVFTFCFLMHITASMFWIIVRQTCHLCTDESEVLYDSQCETKYERGPKPGFTSPDFCPAVWRLRGYEAETGQPSPPTISDSYYISFYWSILAMLGDNAAPDSNIQFMFSIFMSMVGIVVFSTIIGALSALLSSMDKLGEAKQEQLDSINQYMAFRRVNQPLQLRIRAYYKYLWESGQSGHQRQMFDELPPTLSFELTLSLKEELVVNVPMFRRCPPETVLAIVKLLDSLVAIPEEAVVKQGSKNKRMYFCARGKLHVVVTMADGTNAEIAEINAGDFFGETAIFNPDATAGATVRTLVYCELEVLAFDGLRKLMLQDTVLAAEIKVVARSNFVKMKNLKNGRVAVMPKKRLSVEKALQRKYKQDSGKYDMMSKLHSATHALVSGVTTPTKKRASIHPQGDFA